MFGIGDIVELRMYPCIDDDVALYTNYDHALLPSTDYDLFDVPAGTLGVVVSSYRSRYLTEYLVIACGMVGWVDDHNLVEVLHRDG